MFCANGGVVFKPRYLRMRRFFAQLRQNPEKKNISILCVKDGKSLHTIASLASLASLAQLVRERVAVNDEVAGSIPAGSVINIFFYYLKPKPQVIKTKNPT